MDGNLNVKPVISSTNFLLRKVTTL